MLGAYLEHILMISANQNRTPFFIKSSVEISRKGLLHFYQQEIIIDGSPSLEVIKLEFIFKLKIKRKC